MNCRTTGSVVARISSYNHPVLYMAKALGAPLIAGNSVVVKPSPLAPLSAMLLTDIVRTILPPGLLNLVNGRVETGRSLVSDPSVRRISFTGSLRSGLSASRDAGAQHVKEMTLETGGKNVIIVFADSDIEKSAHGVVAGMHFNTTAGQSCTSTSRLLVEASVQDEVLELVRAVEAGQSLRQAAISAGFGSYAQCHRVCAAAFGCSPRDFFGSNPPG